LLRQADWKPFAQRAALLLALGLGAASSVAALETLSVRVVRALPHDPAAFTQGLVYIRDPAGSVFLESTGLHGRSTLRVVDVVTGGVRHSLPLPGDQFGEGLAIVGERLVQLTWRSGVAHVYALNTLDHLVSWNYEGEGWGLCHDGAHFVMSDGSATLQFRDSERFEVVRTIDVALLGRPVRRLNELECVDGAVYANVWGADQIIKVNLLSGEVEAVIDAAGLLTPAERRGADVLNGIAYASGAGTFYLTGKLWPKVFEVTFEPSAPR